MQEKKCPCDSGQNYTECCQPFHEGLLPKTALELMRSRYSAYALNLPDYILATTHPANVQYTKNRGAWREGVIQFSKSTLFQKLEILEAKEFSVTFVAHLLQGGKDVTFTEKSFFEKIGDQWLYKEGMMVPGRVSHL